MSPMGWLQVPGAGPARAAWGRAAARIRTARASAVIAGGLKQVNLIRRLRSRLREGLVVSSELARPSRLTHTPFETNAKWLIPGLLRWVNDEGRVAWGNLLF